MNYNRWSCMVSTACSFVEIMVLFCKCEDIHIILFFSWEPRVHQLGWFVAKSSALFSHRSEVKRMFEHHWLVSVSWWRLCKHTPLLLRSSLVVEVTLHPRTAVCFESERQSRWSFQRAVAEVILTFLFSFFWVIFTTFSTPLLAVPLC